MHHRLETDPITSSTLTHPDQFLPGTEDFPWTATQKTNPSRKRIIARGAAVNRQIRYLSVSERRRENLPEPLRGNTDIVLPQRVAGGQPNVDPDMLTRNEQNRSSPAVTTDDRYTECSGESRVDVALGLGTPDYNRSRVRFKHAERALGSPRRCELMKG